MVHPWWRAAWGGLGDAVAELSSVRELLEAKKDTTAKLSVPDYATMKNELASVRRECTRIERALQELSTYRRTEESR